MAALGDTRPQSLVFFVFSVLIAANLVLITYNVARSNTSSNGTQSSFQSNTTSLQTIFNELGQATGIPDGLAKVSSSVNKTYSHSVAFVGNTAHGSVHFVGHTAHSGLYAMVHGENDVVNFASNTVNVETYIQPASDTKIPVISPIPVVTVVKAIAAEAPPVSTPAKVVATINTTTTLPIPTSDILNGYAWGNCTWWVAIERERIGDPIPDDWGNAATWADRAALDGYTVDHTPTPGSIMQTADSAGGLGHVALVTSVDPDGTWHITEMNVLGLDRVDERALPASAAAYFNFIHDKN